MKINQSLGENFITRDAILEKATGKRGRLIEVASFRLPKFSSETARVKQNRFRFLPAPTKPGADGFFSDESTQKFSRRKADKNEARMASEKNVGELPRFN